MLMIRLQRVGKRNTPSFRVVLTDKRNAPKSGRFLEVLGSYNPKHKDQLALKKERILHWLSNGAQASDTMHNLLVREKIIDAPKRAVVPPSKLKKKVAAEEKKEVAEVVSEKAESKAVGDSGEAEPIEKQVEEPAKEEPSPEEKKEGE